MPHYRYVGVAYSQNNETLLRWSAQTFTLAMILHALTLDVCLDGSGYWTHILRTHLDAASAVNIWQ